VTRWHVIHGDLLDIRADGLLCSANPNLNLSGGVGGALSLRYGPAMQEFLYGYLRERNVKHVPPGTAVIAPPCNTPFRAVAHAVAIDVFYDTTSDLVLQTYLAAIEALSSAGCRTIATACLGCGYGRLSVAEFEKSIAALIAKSLANVDDITLATTNESLAASLRLLMGEP